MFDWLRRALGPLPAADEKPKKASGFFNTDFSAQPYKRPTFSEVLARSIIIQPGKFAKVEAALDGKEGNIVAAMDGDMSQFIAPYGNGQLDATPPLMMDWFAAQYFIGFQMCAIIAQHWLVNKACTMPARDAMRHGYEITVDEGIEAKPKFFDQMKVLDKKYKINKNCVQLIRMGRIFGIRIAMFVVKSNDKQYYEKPFNIDGVTTGSYQGISQIDPYWITPELDDAGTSDPSSLHFYEPTWWRIRGQRVHCSHLVIYRHCEVPDVLKPTYYYGGISVPQQMAQRVYAAERTADEAPMLAMSKRCTVIHTNLESAVANQQEFESKMATWAQYRDNWGIKAVGEQEVIEQFDTNLANFDETLMTQFQLASSIASVPAVKLLETSPKGFNATGDFEMESYHEGLQTMQSNDIEPMLDRHYQLVMKSDFPQFANVTLHIKWNPVDTPDAKELADTNLAKAQTGAALVQSGAIDGTDERQRIVREDNSGYTGIPEIVPGGPGDREAEQAREEEMQQALMNGGGNEGNGNGQQDPQKN